MTRRRAAVTGSEVACDWPGTRHSRQPQPVSNQGRGSLPTAWTGRDQKILLLQSLQFHSIEARGTFSGEKRYKEQDLGIAGSMTAVEVIGTCSAAVS